MTRIVHLFVFDSLSDWEPGHAIAGIHNPQFQRAPGSLRVETVSAGGRSVVTAGGMRITPDRDLAGLQPADSAMLILPGGASWDAGAHLDAVDCARRFLEAGVPVAAICGATAGLARGGLLDERAHTSNSREYLAATGYAGAAHYRQVPAVTDRGLTTSPAMAPLEFARAIFERLQVYAPDVLEAWYQLFSTQRPEHFARLMAAAEGGRSG